MQIKQEKSKKVEINQNLIHYRKDVAATTIIMSTLISQLNNTCRTTESTKLET